MANYIELLNEYYFPLSDFLIPENMEDVWNEAIKDWPKELRDEADAIYEDNTIIMKPRIFNNLLSDDNYKFTMATGAIIHELLHTALRIGGETVRKTLYREIREKSGIEIENRVNLYFEEAAAELMTIYIMVNEFGIDNYCEDYKISYEPAVVVLAKYLVDKAKSPFSFLKRLFISDDYIFLVREIKTIIEYYDNLLIVDIIAMKNNYLKLFCESEF